MWIKKFNKLFKNYEFQLEEHILDIFCGNCHLIDIYAKYFDKRNISYLMSILHFLSRLKINIEKLFIALYLGQIHVIYRVLSFLIGNYR